MRLGIRPEALEAFHRDPVASADQLGIFAVADPVSGSGFSVQIEESHDGINSMAKHFYWQINGASAPSNNRTTSNVPVRTARSGRSNEAGGVDPSGGLFPKGSL